MHCDIYQNLAFENLNKVKDWKNTEADCREETFKWEINIKMRISKITLKTPRALRTKLVEVMEFQLSYFKSWKTML